MQQSEALLPQWIYAKPNRLIVNAAAVVAGSLLLAVLAHLSITLPFTPVPITGQTFGVAFLALTWGSRRAVASFLTYLLEGFAGLPVFATTAVGAYTYGYLFGMLVACFVVGSLADRGYARGVASAFLCAVAGSVCIFTFGLLGLSFFLPKPELLPAGLLPFIPGDLIKNLAAASIAGSLARWRRR